jgi:hypothetical protein
LQNLVKQRDFKLRLKFFLVKQSGEAAKARVGLVQGARKLMGDNLKPVWAEFSTLS